VLAVPLLKKLIQKVTDSVKIPVIISEGMGSKERIILAYQFGATMLVIGTAFDINIEFFNLIAND
jgi:putative glycerol-1-phosphate prenyltransferase